MKPSVALKIYGSDKVVCDPINYHHYEIFYDNLFGELKGKLNILEIGVLLGQSLMAWRLAFPDAKITGIDTIGKGIDGMFDVAFIKADIKTITLTEKYDVIIDDSSHDLKESTYIVSNFCENLTEQGVIVIEDIQIPDLYISGLLKVLPEGFVMDTHDFRQATNGKKHDDFIIKIKRDV